ncbi:thymidylate synthase [Rasiella sp. SM2506]|uniref:thymidylate synthase n=1 Tax=Rasiella sp. SM2506 TaxID=3423914 RepID=UPI003D7B9F95
MKATYQTPHGPMDCFKNCLIFKLVGTGISAIAAKEIMQYAYDHYGNNKFVFISNREFASNIDPKAYDAINPKLMVGLAIVSQEEAVKQEAIQEQQLYLGSFSYFKTVEEAKDWATTVVKNS